MLAIFALTVLCWLIAKFVLLGPDLSQFDNSTGQHFESHADDSSAAAKTLDSLRRVRGKIAADKSIRQGLITVRQFADELSADLITESTFTSVDINGLDAEWTVAPQVASNRRVLFFHGGAFIFGSARGHRMLTDQLSKITNAAVLSVNYRMLPENGRLASVKDAHVAYQWLLQNGPNGPQALEFLLVAGDSAGGSLALMISSWSKHNARRRPDGVIGFAPSLDMTFCSPTIKQNQKTDKMLGNSLGSLSKLPSTIRAWLALLILRMKPANPLASPLFGDLSDLPPTLIQCSDNEVLLGDSIRYTNKATAAGSKVTLQIWPNQIHDWQLFSIGQGSAITAWAEVRKFVSDLG